MKTLNKFLNIDWTFKHKDARPGRHGIHRYPATMHAHCVSSILDILNIKGIVLDPFGGSGTVALECAKNKITAYTNDLNPLACLISQAKLDYYKNDLKKISEDIIKKINDKKFTNLEKTSVETDEELYDLLIKHDCKCPHFKNISYWFKPKVVAQLQHIKDLLPNNVFFKTTFSEVVRIVSNRRAGEFKLFRRSDLNDYNPDVFKEFINILNKNIDLVFNDYLKSNHCKILNNDTKNLKNIPNDSVSCVITSPPYGDSKTTVAYGQFSRLSLQWLEIENSSQIDNHLLGGKNNNKLDLHGSIVETIEQINDINSSRANEVVSFFSDLSISFREINKKCKDDSYHVWIVGNRTVKGVLVPLNLFIRDIAKECGFKFIGQVSRNILNKTMPSLNSPSNQVGKSSKTMSEEHIIILKK